MENTSKALLIAAGVLIAILLVVMGVRVIDSMRGVSDQTAGAGQSIGIATDKITQQLGSILFSKKWKVSADGKTYTSSDGTTVKFRRFIYK